MSNTDTFEVTMSGLTYVVEYRHSSFQEMRRYPSESGYEGLTDRAFAVRPANAKLVGSFGFQWVDFVPVPWKAFVRAYAVHMTVRAYDENDDTHYDPEGGPYSPEGAEEELDELAMQAFEEMCQTPQD